MIKEHQKKVIIKSRGRTKQWKDNLKDVWKDTRRGGGGGGGGGGGEEEQEKQEEEEEEEEVM